MALGAFVAGLLLAETEYRRAVQTTIEPIKSLLLGVFFFRSARASTSSRCFPIRSISWPRRADCIVLQVGVIYGLARLFGIARPASIETATLLAPCGEFAFVILP